MALYQTIFRTHIMKLGLLSFYAVLSAGCQKKPALAPAADPLSAIAPPPMGATTYNDELKRELALLEDLLNQRIDDKLVKVTKDALMTGDMQAVLKEPGSDDAHLTKLFLAMPELVHQTTVLTENQKLWFKAKLYFLKRRFVEAAMHMSEVLKVEPDFLQARNWRARAIFFLGNPDLAVNELTAIIRKSGEKSPEGLDALYLIGAVSYESNDLDPMRLTTGINAWQKYLDLSDPDEQLKKEIKVSLAELQVRLKGEKLEPKLAFDPFLPREQYGAEKNAILRSFAKDELLMALELSDQALKKAYDADIATIKARILFKTGRLDEASELFTFIVTKDQKYAPGFHYRGMAFMLKGQVKDAVLSWQRTLEVDPAYARSHGLEQRIAVAEKMVAPVKVEMH